MVHSGKSTPASDALYVRALELMPGGVNSPVRAFKAVGGTPRFITHAAGPRMFDADGNSLLDYVGSWGPLILGHAHPAVVEAIQQTAARGASFGCPTELELELAERVCEAYPSIEMLRMVNSGTEAGMAVVRLARGATGRPCIVKMEGCYHGHADSLLARAGSGVATFGLPDSPGVPAAVAADTLTLPFNDLEALDQLFNQHGDRIAAVMVEPVAGNMGLVAPRPGYLQGLREITRAHGALLIFDEVMTGFRVAYGGAQALYGVVPDLTMLGKILGGGLPAAAYGGRRDLMQRIAPAGPIYQAGTLSGNPLAMRAGIATLKILRDGDEHGPIYPRLEKLSARLEVGLAQAANAEGVPIFQSRVGSMLGLFFCASPVENYEAAKQSDTAQYARWFHSMLDQGHYFAPSQFEAAFVSAAHTEADIDATIAAARLGFGTLAEGHSRGKSNQMTLE